MERLCERLSVRGAFFSIPTAVFAELATDGEREPRTRLLRGSSGDSDLARLAALDALRDRVSSGLLPAAAALVELRRLEIGPLPWPRALQVPAYALASCTTAVLFGGGLAEAVTAGLLGAIVGALEAGSRGSSALQRLLEPLSATLAALLVALASARGLRFAPDITVISGIIALMPGFVIWTGMTELSTGHLVSGTARMARALAILAMMGFGVALGSALGGALLSFVDGAVPPVATATAGAALASSPSVEAPAWLTLLALLGSALAYAVLFSAPLRELGWVVLSVVLAWAGAVLGSAWLGPTMGMFVAAAGLGIFANGYARFLGRPAATPLVPGMMQLVPGSLGFRGVASLLRKDSLAGIDAGFEVLMVAVSLVAGLLLANLLLPARRR
jgi:uncharacterized membrane protein YjjP (DUF1212 family)